ncbi:MULTISPECIES: ATP-binding protein [Vibrio]|uniref:histidine kinase n=6 Tax=Vibrio TaxID=662 RepID=A0A2N7NP96_9VIBR|nr:transporter substrate-binding domain-containing protein [Vibrio tasmaniensis]PMP18742.1 ATPase [Vibrio tasmaniensis]TKG30774.1 transporter substrate-binding domain-containing protein [Vibrio tasmaniensis]TKG40055.1 transporter substrate-binding domain-containing protein [Vibrio tasmaniensis]TKG44116.1 transporter substrate-binding domain-containing protein [Vibrio tasmaniensis]TKG50276.1 transporter substrate-binding domain-containing protein [Vibrio tasmaniensis]
MFRAFNLLSLIILASSVSFYVKASGSITIGVQTSGFSPYVVVQEGEVSGLLPELTGFYAERELNGLEFVGFHSPSDLNNVLKTEQVDAIITAEQNVSSSGVIYSKPILSSRMVSLSSEPIESHLLMKGRNLAYFEDSSNASSVKSLLPFSSFKSYSSYQTAIAAVARENALAIVDDGVLLHNKLMNSPYELFLSVNLHDGLPLNNYVIALLDTPENRKLLGIINNAINQDNSSKLVNIRKKWLNEIQRRLLLVVSKNKLLLTEKEQQFLLLNPNIYVSSTADSKPISFMNSEGKPDGISIDILSEISRLTGLNFIYDNDLDLQGNQAHPVSLPVIHTKATPSTGDDEHHLYSKPFMVEPWALVGKSDTSKLAVFGELTKSSVIGTINDSVGIELVKRYCEACPIKTYSSELLLLDAVDTGEVDSAMLSLYLASPLLQGQYSGYLRVTSLLSKDNDIPVAYSVEADQEVLNNIINKALFAIPHHKYQQIKKHWLDVSYESGVDTADVILGAAILISVASVLIMLVMAWSWKLRREVEDRKRTESALKHQVEFERSLLDAMPFPIVVRNLDNQIISLNSAAQQLTGFELIEGTIVNNSDEDTMIHHGVVLPRLEKEVVSPQGSKHYAYWKCPYISNGNIEGSVTILDDLTELYEAKKIAKSADDRVQKLANNLHGAVIQHIQPKRSLHDIEFVFISNGVEELLGLTPAQLRRSPISFFAPLNAQDRRTLIKKVRSGNKEGKLSLDIGVNIDNQNRWLNLQSKISDLGDYYEWDSVLTDITELKQQQEELTQARQSAIAATEAKSRFLANMSHEIRTPLGGIVSLLELSEQYEVGYEVQKIHTTLSQSANNLLHIVNDILDFSKIEAGKLTLDYQPASLDTLTLRVTQLQARQAHAKGLQFKFWLDPELNDLVLMDDIRIGQVLNNLLSNAIKFTEYGTVGLAAKLLDLDGEQQQICFEVFDSGIGISEEHIRNLFQPFVQADEGTTRKYGGSGLGLTISKQLIEQMGGSLNVTSKINIGSTFSITLPLKTLAENNRADMNGKVALLTKTFMQQSELENYLTSWGIKVISKNVQVTKELAHWVDTIEPDFVFIPHELDQSIDTFAESVQFICVSEQGMLSPAPCKLGWNLSANPLLPSQLMHCLHNCPAFVEDIVQDDNNLKLSTESRESAKQNQRLILIAEDHPINQQIILQQIEQLGFHADMVDNGKEALVALDNEDYGLLITDCHMPEMDGYELTRQIRVKEQSQNQPRLPIIALTANAVQGENDKCFEIGMDDFLSKPTKLRVIGDTIIKHLDKVQSVVDKPCISSSEPKSEPSSAPIDLANLTELFGDQDLVMQIITDFIKSHQADMPLLQAACKQRDLEAIKQVAHKMKGAAKMVGTEDIANQLQTMELVSLSDLDGIQAHYDNLEQLTNQLKTYCSESIKPFKELP